MSAPLCRRDVEPSEEPRIPGESERRIGQTEDVDPDDERIAHDDPDEDGLGRPVPIER